MCLAKHLQIELLSFLDPVHVFAITNMLKSDTFILFVMVNKPDANSKAKKKGKHNNLYLQQSDRKEGKVITKELYLGKEIPDNIEEIKAKLMHDSHQALFEKT